MKLNKRNICMIAYSYYPTDRRIRNYCEALTERGFSVDVFGLKINKNDRSEIQVENVNVYQIQLRDFSDKTLFDYLFNIGKFFFKCFFHIIKHFFYKKYFVIHVHNMPDFLVFCALIPKLLGSYIILDIHDVLPEHYCQKFNVKFSSIFIKLLLIVEKLSIKFSDYVIVANDIWLEKLRQRCNLKPKNSKSILNYPQINRFKNFKKIKTENFTIIYPGTLSKLHGVDVAIKAMAYVHKVIPSATLIIYGAASSNIYKKYLNKLILDLNLQNCIKIREQVGYCDLIEVYKYVDIGIVPKREGVFSSEAFSTKIFDFLASMTPIVISKTKIDQYYFNEDILKFFQPGNYKNLASSIVELYFDHLARKNMVKNGLKYIEKCNWEKKKDKYYEIINCAVERA